MQASGLRLTAQRQERPNNRRLLASPVLAAKASKVHAAHPLEFVRQGAIAGQCRGGF